MTHEMKPLKIMSYYFQIILLCCGQYVHFWASSIAMVMRSYIQVWVVCSFRDLAWWKETMTGWRSSFVRLKRGSVGSMTLFWVCQYHICVQKRCSSCSFDKWPHYWALGQPADWMMASSFQLHFSHPWLLGCPYYISWPSFSSRVQTSDDAFGHL